MSRTLTPTEYRQMADIMRFYADDGVPTQGRAEFDQVLLVRAHRVFEDELAAGPRRARRKELAERLELIEFLLGHIGRALREGRWWRWTT